jgi:hypothetical protein
MADYPSSIYSPRTKTNRNGVVYDPYKQSVPFAEDVSKLDAEVVALETFLRIPTSIPASPVAGSAYFTTNDFVLHIYTGTVWKTIALS